MAEFQPSDSGTRLQAIVGSRDEFIELLREIRDTLHGGGGGGNYGSMEARLAKVEADVDHIKINLGDMRTDVRQLRDNARTDFRALFGAVIAVAVGLAGLMAKGFGWL